MDRDPDWHNNPPELDTTEEVARELRMDGLNPMDIGTAEEASFGHSLVHAYADDADHGGRTPEQLEAEHDRTVQAMQEHGMRHRSPLDLDDIV